MRKITAVIGFFSVFAWPVWAQTANTHTLVFTPVFAGAALRFDNSFYKTESGDSVQIELLRFYISGIEVLNNNKTVWFEENSFHLISTEDANSLSLTLNLPASMAFNQIKFNIGIDSITNVSGALGGALDPTRGMYWTWQNGYINFKLEGRSNLCATHGNQFQFHLGGYSYPFNALQTIVLNTGQGTQTVININLAKFFSEIDLAKQNHLMSPAKEAVEMAAKVAGVFSTGPK